ncbi:MAG: hypothetical protein WBA74_15005, partial [Cyclobacteriaceae bacterium]
IEMRTLIKSLNEEYGTTIFISSHLLSEIDKTCSHVGIIKEGKMIFQDRVTTLKETQNENLVIEIETNRSDQVSDTISPFFSNTEIISESFVNTTLRSKDEIPVLIDKIRKENIDIYQITIKNNLEELFLSLTEK